MIKADYFKETVLKIESDNISAVEVALHLDELRGNIMLRKEEQYLSPEIENEKQNLIANCEFDEAIIHKVINTFFGNCKSNIIHIFITELRDLFFFQMMQMNISAYGVNSSMRFETFRGSYCELCQFGRKSIKRCNNFPI